MQQSNTHQPRTKTDLTVGACLAAQADALGRAEAIEREHGGSRDVDELFGVAADAAAAVYRAPAETLDEVRAKMALFLQHERACQHPMTLELLDQIQADLARLSS